MSPATFPISYLTIFFILSVALMDFFLYFEYNNFISTYMPNA